MGSLVKPGRGIALPALMTAIAIAVIIAFGSLFVD
jgi:hypothetical protein